jgi:hypothetical protein
MHLIKPIVLTAFAIALPLQALALDFPATGGRGAPSSSAGGGMRGSVCVDTKTPLTALVPANQVNTFSGRQGVIFVSVPAVKSTAELYIQDDQQNVIYETTVQLKGKAGILQLRLPETIVIQPNKTYTWEFSIVCDTHDRTKDQIIQGKMQRVPTSVSLQKALKTAPPLRQAELYAKEKIWQETLIIASQLRSSNPKAWEGLLTSVNLKAIAKQPFITP